MLVPSPSLATLGSNNNGHVTPELQLARLRAQVAVVRTLADQIEDFARPGDADALGEQLIEEVARLGFRLLEVTSPTTTAPRPKESGVFSRLFSF